ncbi:MAG: sugar phosphate isomerase/epimerase [Pirellulales bacterium]|nr:sugar phosphate isomerase/epimerase [Pirellulales bacterium]
MRWWWGKPTQGKLDMLDFLDYCAKLDFEAAEITSYFFEDPLERSYINQVKRRAHVLGLDISGGAISNNFGYPPGSDEAKRHMAYTRQWIDHFADMGAPVIRTFATKSPPKGASDDEIKKNVSANLVEALGYAEKRGVMLGLENHDFVKNIDYLLEILDGIDSKWLGVIWDSANLAPTPDPYAELARIAPYAVTAQLKVMTRVNGKDVQADYGRMIKILRDAKYSGYLALEYEEPEDPFKAIPGFVKEVREALEKPA